MTSRICARLLLMMGMAGLAQMEARAQATLNAAQSQFGTEPAPYASPATPVTERAEPVTQPGAYNPGGSSYAPQQQQQQQPEVGPLGAPDPSKPLGRGTL